MRTLSRLVDEAQFGGGGQPFQSLLTSIHRLIISRFFESGDSSAKIDLKGEPDEISSRFAHYPNAFNGVRDWL